MNKASSVSFFQHYFQYLPEENNQPKRAKDALDHITKYVNKQKGTWDVFRLITQIAEGVKYFVSSAASSVAEKVQNVFSAAGSALSVPYLISNVNSLKTNAMDLHEARKLPDTDPSKARKVAQATKKTFTDALVATGTTSQIALFAEGSKLINLSSTARAAAEGISNLVFGAADAIDLVDEYTKWNHFKTLEASTSDPRAAEVFREKKTLAMIDIVKNVSSVAGAIFGLAALVFGALPLATLIFMTTGTLWLTMKLISHFYNQVIVEAPKGI